MHHRTGIIWIIADAQSIRGFMRINLSHRNLQYSLQLIFWRLLVLLPRTRWTIVLYLQVVHVLQQAVAAAHRRSASVSAPPPPWPLHGVQLSRATRMSIGCRYPFFSCLWEVGRSG
jgi:hypothetical protein